MPMMLLRALCFVLLAVAVPSAQHPDDELASPKLRIGWDEFRKLYDAKQVEVVDVRGRVEFESGHIPGARRIAVDDMRKHVEALRKLKKPIVLYCACASEFSAARGARTLQKEGLDARALIGGYHRWLDEGLKIETGKGAGR
jgi:rhodanese-related sulfurtransferase